MRAIRVHVNGGPDVLQLVEDVPRPSPGPGEVLVKVAAAGVNYADIGRRRGRYGAPQPLPYIPGIEVAGTVEETGPGEPVWQPGQRVMGNLPGGGYAEYALVPADHLIPVPESMDFVQAAALPLQGLTAYHILRLSAQLQQGETVLVHAAAGGVGTLAVQLAKLMGAGKVIATASSAAKLELARALGADAGINYTEGPFVEQVLALTDGRGADVVLEAVGGPVFDQSLEALAPFGRIVVYGTASGQGNTLDPRRLMARNQAVTGFFLNQVRTRPEAHRSAVRDLLAYVEAGQLRPVIGNTYPLAEASRAHAEMESRASTGKLVLTV